MGLDIYLHRYDKPRKQIEKEDEAWEKISNEIYQRHKAAVEKRGGEKAEFTDADRDAWHAETKSAAEKSNRAGDWGHENPNNPQIEINSALYPEHMFKIGYFRSSYNAGGINHVLADRVNGEDLYTLLGVDRDEYIQQPDWKQVVKNCDRVLVEFRKAAAKNPYSVIEVGPNIFSNHEELPNSEAEALKIIEKTLSKKQDSLFSNGYSNNDGHWWPMGSKVFAVVPGTKEFMNRKMPTSYVAVRYDADGEEPFKWYVNAIEIVRETALWVLSQENPEKYFLHVSG